MPWGSGPWGTGSFGGGTDPVSLVSAYAISMNEVQVNASGSLLVRSTVLSGDASNPSTWTIVRADTGESVQVVSVSVISPSQVVLRTLFTIPQFGVNLTVVANNLLDALGGLILPPRFLSFQGRTEEAFSTQQRSAVTLTGSSIDLLNRQVQSSEGSLMGTLVVKGGDYANQSGNDLLRKLIIRRIVAAPGDFFHLQNYGVGLKVKQPLPGGDLVKLKSTIQRQVSLEKDVDSVSVSLTQSANLLTIAVSVKVKATGERLDVGVPFQVQGG